MDTLFRPFVSDRLPAPPTHVAIAIPVRNEAARLGPLLASLGEAALRSDLPVKATILANDCRDASAEIARAFAHPRLEVDVVEVAYGDGRPSAGRSRRHAMDLAASPGGLLITTDGDAILDPDWISAALRACRAGADVVCGAIEARYDHVLASASGARITRAEAAYCALVHEIRHAIDQVAGRQPVGGALPHYTESGAALAIRAECYLAAGGLPALFSSEDRALVHLAERHGLRIVYAPGMRARVSARLRGRAVGGMADCLRSRMSDADPLADQAMLSPDVLRALWQGALRGDVRPYPDRSEPFGPRLRASDLERNLIPLRSFVEQTLRPRFDEWKLIYRPECR